LLNSDNCFSFRKR